MLASLVYKYDAITHWGAIYFLVCYTKFYVSFSWLLLSSTSTDGLIPAFRTYILHIFPGDFFFVISFKKIRCGCTEKKGLDFILDDDVPNVYHSCCIVTICLKRSSGGSIQPRTSSAGKARWGELEKCSSGWWYTRRECPERQRSSCSWRQCCPMPDWEASPIPSKDT